MKKMDINIEKTVQKLKFKFNYVVNVKVLILLLCKNNKKIVKNKGLNA